MESVFFFFFTFLEVDVENSIFSHFLCKSGAANDLIYRTTEDYGKCGSVIKSLKAGEICDSSSNCPTNMASITANCVCTPNEQGNKYCTFEKGNSEWENIAIKFRKYIETTRTSHKMRRLDEDCDLPSISYD